MWPAADGDCAGWGDDARMEFLDRRDAGCKLAARLLPFAGERPIVIALPRGGVPVAVEVARALDAPLDILAVRKLGAPANPEYGVGAITEDGTAVLNTETARRVGMTRQALDASVEREVKELRRRVESYRDGRQRIDVRGRTVIVVDDGLATGLTDLAAVRSLRARGRHANRRRGPGWGTRVGSACRGGGRRGRLSHDPTRAARCRPLVPRLLAGLRRGGDRCAGRRFGAGAADGRDGAHRAGADCARRCAAADLARGTGDRARAVARTSARGDLQSADRVGTNLRRRRGAGLANRGGSVMRRSSADSAGIPENDTRPSSMPRARGGNPRCSRAGGVLPSAPTD
jgi:adenine/guanine phosphoribosyltransferase-like PRPP-binding protein